MFHAYPHFVTSAFRSPGFAVDGEGKIDITAGNSGASHYRINDPTDSAAAGPIVTHFRDRVGANSDSLYREENAGRNNAGAYREYVRLQTSIWSAAAGSEAGRFTVATINGGGTPGGQLIVGSGVVLGASANGADMKGTGSLNAKAGVWTTTLNAAALPEFANDAAAASLDEGEIYRTATGEVRVKLAA